jgi:hypothetical protein
MASTVQQVPHRSGGMHQRERESPTSSFTHPSQQQNFPQQQQQQVEQKLRSPGNPPDDDFVSRHYSVIGLRTWGQNFYDEVLRNAARQSAGLDALPPAPSKFPELGVRPGHCVSESTPQSMKVQLSSPDAVPQTTVTKHLNGMLDELVVDVFEDPGAKTSRKLDYCVGESPREGEERFTIAAIPSPTRDSVGPVSQKPGVVEVERFPAPQSDHSLSGQREVVLEVDVMSPILRQIHEIEQRGDGTVRNEKAEVIDIEIQESTDVEPAAARDNRKKHGRVPSLIHYFASQQEQRQGDSKKAEIAGAKHVTNGKPPLLPMHHSHYHKRNMLGFLHDVDLNGMAENLVAWAARATQGRRKMLAVIALSYLVLLHVFLISGRL